MGVFEGRRNGSQFELCFENWWVGVQLKGQNEGRKLKKRNKEKK